MRLPDRVPVPHRTNQQGIKLHTLQINCKNKLTLFFLFVMLSKHLEVLCYQKNIAFTVQHLPY